MSGELSSDQLQQLYLCSLLGRKREQPIFTCKAHVFHIDPMTKRSWVPASSAAVPVSFFYDSSRALYRIISVEGTKAVINSTVSPGMNFTKTSQKFGQWSDVRANTVYGLGFPSEAELNKFSEQFLEVREATRASGKHSQSSHHVPMSNNLAGLNNAVTIPPPSMMSSPLLQRSQINQQQQQHQNNALITQNGQTHEDTDVLMNDANANSLLKGNCSTLTKNLGVPPVPNSLANNVVTSIGTIDSPKHTGTLGRQDKSPEAQLKYENERLRLALAQSSVNAKKWEVELSTLKTNNARLTAALTESTANVEEWKRQLHAYKEDNQRLKQRTLEAEAAKGNSDAALELRNEIGLMREKVEYLSQQLQSKDEELRMLNEIVNGSNSDAVKENELLRATLNEVQAQLETALGTQDSQRKVLEALNSQLAEKVKDLGSIHRELNTVLQTCN